VGATGAHGAVELVELAAEHDAVEERREGGFAAETGAAVAIYTATMLGVGISTTHTITGAIVGVGATRRLSAVRWGVARQIVWAWVLTIPAAAAIGAVTYLLIRTALP
jgi:PiT family inorganic phosphate transporter